jgi:hypothetical protein
VGIPDSTWGAVKSGEGGTEANYGKWGKGEWLVNVLIRGQEGIRRGRRSTV